MGFLLSAVISTLMLGTVHGGHLKIPQVQAVVGRVVSELDSYVHYNSNISETSVVDKRTSSYWYESITHQGISAFGPGGYSVYRNVRDYGAKGIHSQ